MNYHKNRGAHNRDAEEIRKIGARFSFVDEFADSVLALAFDESQGNQPFVVEAVLEVVDGAHGHHVSLELR